MRRFLVLQARPEPEASDDEFAAILNTCRIAPDRVHRIRVDREDIPGDLDVTAYAGVIVGGGPGCVSDDPATKDPVEARIERQILRLMPQITQADHPYMGCCYGLGILVQHLGGVVNKDRYGEPVGPTLCQLETGAEADPLLTGLRPEFQAFVGHKEAVQRLPRGALRLVTSAPCPVQMIRYRRNVYATQFHPEADAAGFAQRIRVYRNHGYFPPGDADRLIAAVNAATVEVPGEILRRFAQRYG